MTALAWLLLASGGWAVYAVGTMALLRPGAGVAAAGLAAGVFGVSCLAAIGYGVYAAL